MPEDLPELITNEKKEQGPEVWFLSEETPVPSLETALASKFKVTRWFHSESIESGISTEGYPTREAEIAAAAKRKKIVEGTIVGLFLLLCLAVVGSIVALVLHHQGRL